jgi:hypothetical protein
VLEEFAKAVGEKAEVQRALLGKGPAVQDKILAARTRMKEVQSEIADARIAQTRLRREEAQQQNRIARELLEFETKTSALEREITTLKDEIRRNTGVTAPRDGVMSEVAANIGEDWRGPMIRMLPIDETETGTLIGELYVRSEDARNLPRNARGDHPVDGARGEVRLDLRPRAQRLRHPRNARRRDAGLDDRGSHGRPPTGTREAVSGSDHTGSG